MAEIERETHEALAGIAAGDPVSLRETLGLWGPLPEAGGLDPRATALVRLAALIALDAPPSAYGWQLADAVNAGIGPEEMLAVLRTIAPQVGASKAIAAAPEMMLALGLELPEGTPGLPGATGDMQ